MYTFGYGTSTSAGDAIYWFEKSASRDNVSALFNLAVFHIEGHMDTPKIYRKELNFFQERLN